jgi:hypothetical protein
MVLLRWNVFEVQTETVTARLIRPKVEIGLLSTNGLWVSMALYLSASEAAPRRTFGVNLAWEVQKLGSGSILRADPPYRTKAPLSSSHHLSGTLGLHSLACKGAGIVALRQPYKDSGSKFGGKPVTKPNGIGHHAVHGQGKCHHPPTHWSTTGHGAGDAVLRIVCRRIRCSRTLTDCVSVGPRQ